MTEQFNLTLTGRSTPSQSEPESNDNEGVLHIFQTPGLKLHPQMQLNIIPRALNGRKYFYPTQIIQAQSAGAVEYTDCFLCRGVKHPQRMSCIWH